MKSWKTLSTKQLVDNARLSVFEDEVELPSGHKTTYIRYGNGAGAAAVIAVNTEGKILVQKEYSYPPDAWMLHFPAGAINKAEDPKVAAEREFAEEAQLKGDLSELGWFYSYNRRSADKFYVYVATNLSSTVGQKDAEEDIEHYWYTVDEIDQMIAGDKIPNHSFLAIWCLFKAKSL